MPKQIVPSVAQLKQKVLKIAKLPVSHNSNGLQGFLAKAVAGTFGLKVANAGLGYLVSLLLARFLGVEGYGVYAYGLAWVTLMRIPAMLGISSLVVRDLAVYQSKKSWGLAHGLLLWSNRVVLVASVTLALLAAYLVKYLLPDSSEQTLSVFWIAMCALPLVALSSIKQSVMQALNHIVKAQLPELLVRPLLLVGLLCGAYVLLKGQLTASWAMAIYVIATGIAFIMVSFFVNQSLPPKFKNIQPEYNRQEWIQTALPMLFIGGMYIINNQADMIMLGAITEPATVGIYAVANRAASLISFVLVAFNTSVAPTFASLYSRGNLDSLQQVMTKSSRLILLAALPIATGLIIFGHWFLLLFGSEFIAAKTTLTILCLGQLFNAFTGSVAILLNMTGHQNDTAIGVGISAVLNIILNATLIPQWGSAGAAIATTSSGIIWNILLVFFVYKRLKIYATAIGKIEFKTT